MNINGPWTVELADHFVPGLGQILLIFILVGGFNPLKNISQMGLLFPAYGKIINVPNHQPVLIHSFPL
jgi:hypothetical protein